MLDGGTLHLHVLLFVLWYGIMVVRQEVLYLLTVSNNFIPASSGLWVCTWVLIKYLFLQTGQFCYSSYNVATYLRKYSLLQPTDSQIQKGACLGWGDAVDLWVWKESPKTACTTVAMLEHIWSNCKHRYLLWEKNLAIKYSEIQSLSMSSLVLAVIWPIYCCLEISLKGEYIQPVAKLNA